MSIDVHRRRVIGIEIDDAKVSDPKDATGIELFELQSLRAIRLSIAKKRSGNATAVGVDDELETAITGQRTDIEQQWVSAADSRETRRRRWSANIEDLVLPLDEGGVSER
jgi:hypothetical protein